MGERQPRLGVHHAAVTADNRLELETDPEGQVLRSRSLLSKGNQLLMVGTSEFLTCYPRHSTTTKTYPLQLRALFEQTAEPCSTKRQIHER